MKAENLVKKRLVYYCRKSPFACAIPGIRVAGGSPAIWRSAVQSQETLTKWFQKITNYFHLAEGISNWNSQLVHVDGCSAHPT